MNPALFAALGTIDALTLLTAALGEHARRSGLYVTRAYAFMALVTGGTAFTAVLVAQFAFAVNSAGQSALFGWLWWRSGGGDSTKRRLKQWAGRFTGVRRTAPSPT